MENQSNSFKNITVMKKQMDFNCISNWESKSTLLSSIIRLLNFSISIFKGCSVAALYL